MNLDKKALAGFIAEIEDSRARQKAETEFQRDVFSRAKQAHFDTKAMRIVLQRRAMEPGKRDEQDYNVHAYELALGGLKDAAEAVSAGASVREAARKHGVPRAALAALAAGSENAIFEPADSTNGETEDRGGPAGGPSTLSHPAEQSVNAAPSLAGDPAILRTAKEGNPAPNSDDLEIPPALRRTRAA